MTLQGTPSYRRRTAITRPHAMGRLGQQHRPRALLLAALSLLVAVSCRGRGFAPAPGGCGARLGADQVAEGCLPAHKPRLQGRELHAWAGAVQAAFGTGMGLLGSEQGASAEVMSASDVSWQDPRNWAAFVFYGIIGVLLIKNNLIDFNGPLAGPLGMWTPTCRASHILVSTEAQAQALMAKLQGGPQPPTLEDFADLAKVHSMCKSAKQADGPGELGTIYKGDADDQFHNVCFNEAFPVNVPHGPVKTDAGYHLLWISERLYKPAAA